MNAPLRIERHADAEQFLATAQSWLLEAEVENNLLLGIALSRRSAAPTDPPAYWASIHDTNDRIVGGACRTPPHRLVLSRLPQCAVDSLAADVGKTYSSLNGVNGPAAATKAFADAWVARYGGRWSVHVRMRLHELTRAPLITGVARGSLGKAVEADLPLASGWIAAYVTDTGIQGPASGVAERLIERGQLYFWVDAGEPRSMAAATRDTGSGCSINTVYTPPRYRRRGHATAAVAALSGMLLERGRRFCCLYTDLANPTSNSIYARIGYVPVRDDLEIAFSA
jgi:predicted GNAT family acetyltransferase